MKRDVIFKGSSFDELNEWQTINPKIFVQIAALIEESRRNPFAGKGNPEPLKYQYTGFWSRRITTEHRLVYSVTNDAICIVSCKYHYK